MNADHSDPTDELLNVTVVLKACGGQRAIARTLIQRFFAILPACMSGLYDGPLGRGGRDGDVARGEGRG